MKAKQEAPAGSLARRVRRVSQALAYTYACGWRQHARLVGEPEGMPAEKWARANAHMFTEEAMDALSPNPSGQARRA